MNPLVWVGLWYELLTQIRARVKIWITLSSGVLRWDMKTCSPLMCLFAVFAVVTNPVLQYVQQFCENTVSIELSFATIKKVRTVVSEF